MEVRIAPQLLDQALAGTEQRIADERPPRGEEATVELAPARTETSARC
jgi:hypothetical protein